MKKKTILFDLDGTLLPMDQDAFTRGYFKLLAQKLAPHGYDPAALVDNIWAGTAAMVGNDGKRTNEAAFWDRFAALYGEQVREDIPLFDAFYRQEFQQAKAFCGFTPKARAAVEACKAAGHRVALATNPIFPAVATESRIRWAGLAPETFAWYTTYENIGYCKPNPDYYREILRYSGGGLPDGGQRCGGGYDGRPGGGAVGLSAHRLPAQPEREGHLLLSPGGF